MGEALTLTMGTMGDAVADGELRAVRTCVLGPVEAHASGRENRDMQRAETTCGRRAARGARAGGTRPMHTAARSTPVHRGRSRIAASDVYLCSPLLVSLTFSTVSWPYRVAEAHTIVL